LEAKKIGFSELSDTEHYAIYKLENFTAFKNKLPIIEKLDTIR